MQEGKKLEFAECRRQYAEWVEEGRGGRRKRNIGTGGHARIADFLEEAGGPDKPLPPHKQRLASDALLDFLVEAELPDSVVDKPSSAKYANLLNPRYRKLNRRQVAQELDGRNEAADAELRQDIQRASAVAVGLDGWSTRRMQAMVGVVVYFVDNNVGERSELLAFELFKGPQTAVALRQWLEKILADWDIGRKTTRVSTDNAANMKRALDVGEQALPDSDREEQGQLEDVETPGRYFAPSPLAQRFRFGLTFLGGIPKKTQQRLPLLNVFYSS